MAKMTQSTEITPFWKRILRWFTGYTNKEAMKRAHWTEEELKALQKEAKRCKHSPIFKLPTETMQKMVDTIMLEALAERAKIDETP